jgi:hypothetical protein
VTAPGALSEGVAGARRRTWPAWAAAATALLAVVGWALWWLLWSSPVRADGGFAVGFDDVQPGESRTIGIDLVCLDGAHAAVIEDVTVDPAGLTVVDFAVRHADPRAEFGSFPGPLRGSGFGGSHTVTDQCANGDHAEIAVELVRGTNGPAITEDIDLHWSAGVRSGVLTVPVGAALCLHGEVNEFCSPEPAPFDGVR